MSRDFVKKYLSPFFGTDSGRIKPPFFWVTLFMLAGIVALVVQIASGVALIMDGKNAGLDATIAVIIGAAIGMTAVYNQGHKASMQYGPKPDPINPPDKNIKEGPSDCIQGKRGGGL